MAKYQLLLPKMGESVAEATITKWLKGVGDHISADDAVLEIATDKVDSEVPSPVSGRLIQQLYKEDDIAQVGSVIAIIETEEPGQAPTPPVLSAPPGYTPPPAPPVAPQSIPGISQLPQQNTPPPAPPVAPPVYVAPPPAPVNDVVYTDRFYSPLVKSIASQEGIKSAELDRVPGTGAEGRLTKDDLLAYIARRPSTPFVVPSAQPAPVAAPAPMPVAPPATVAQPAPVPVAPPAPIIPPAPAPVAAPVFTAPAPIVVPIVPPPPVEAPAPVTPPPAPPEPAIQETPAAIPPPVQAPAEEVKTGEYKFSVPITPPPLPVPPAESQPTAVESAPVPQEIPAAAEEAAPTPATESAPEQPAAEEPKAAPAPEPTAPVAEATPPKPAADAKPKTYSATGGDEIIEMDRMRRIISDHMVMSKHTSAHVTSFVEVDVTVLVQWREKIRKNFENRERERITFTPIFIEAVVKAIKDFPMINVSVNGKQIIKKKDINIGMATALPSGNLIVPVIHKADELSLTGLTKAVNDLAVRARTNKLVPDEVRNGTFTITNVGSFGNVMGTPIINQPQVAILAIGVIKKKPAVIETKEGDMIAIRHMMFLSLSYDHRVVDGALGGSFVRRVADYLENWDVNRDI